MRNGVLGIQRDCTLVTRYGAFHVPGVEEQISKIG